MDIKEIEDFISSKYENKNTQKKAKSYVKKGVSIFEDAGILEPTENDFSMIEDKSCKSFTHAFYSWVKGETGIEGKNGKDFSIKKRNINFLLDDEKYKILSMLALQFDTTLTTILTAAIEDFFSSHAEHIEKIKKFLNE